MAEENKTGFNAGVPKVTTEVKMPSIPSNSPMLGKSLNLGKLSSKKAQKAYLQKRRTLPIQILVLKYISILFLFLVGGAFLWLKADLDSNNKYLKLTGLQENTYNKHHKASFKNKTLLTENTNAEKEIKKIEEKIKNKEFFKHQEEINQIKDDQSMQWFDEIDPATGELTLGVFDSFKKIKEFFSSVDYTKSESTDGQISGRQLLSRNEIEIENIVIDRNHASFSVKSSNIYGKVFFLSTEFVEMMNSFSFFKDGILTSYSRQKIKGAGGMSFTLDLKIQEEGEEDPADEKFSEYEDWLKSNQEINMGFDDFTQKELNQESSQSRPTKPRPRKDKLLKS